MSPDGLGTPFSCIREEHGSCDPQPAGRAWKVAPLSGPGWGWLPRQWTGNEIASAPEPLPGWVLAALTSSELYFSLLF